MATTASFDKHPTLWFDDGNVILIAENTGFRVYRGILVEHSEIFRDMFLLPHPPDSELAVQDTYDGCPIVRMAEDEAQEWAVVLGVLYTMSQCRRFYDRGTQLSFTTVVAALRIGLKYAINEIKDESLRRLRKCYPEDLMNNHWDIHIAADSDSSATSQSKDASVCQMVWKPRNSIAVLHLARQFGLDELVPAALYACAIGLSSADLVSASSNQEHQLYALTQPELIECFQVRERLSVDNLRLYDILSKAEASNICVRRHGSTKQLCSAAMSAMVVNAHSRKMMEQRHVLASLDSWLAQYKSEPPNLCATCYSYVSRQIDSRQKEALANFRKFCCPTPENDESDSEDGDESSMDED